MRYTGHDFVLVPPNQKRVDVKLTEFADESDPGPYPLPENAPIEGWPAHYTRYSRRATRSSRDDAGRPPAQQVRRGQRPARDRGRSVNRKLYEFSRLVRTARGWHAAARPRSTSARTSSARTVASATRPGCRSSPGGPPRRAEARKIEHALRVTVRKTRRAYVYPANALRRQAHRRELHGMGRTTAAEEELEPSSFSPR